VFLKKRRQLFVTEQQQIFGNIEAIVAGRLEKTTVHFCNQLSCVRSTSSFWF